MIEGTIHPVDTTTEKKIITALIVSTHFCSEIVPVLRLEWFETDFVKTIIKWIVNYYKKYKQAPMVHIKDLFEQERRYIKGDVASLIEQFLIQLSENYILDEENKEFNVAYYVDLAFAHFRERSLQNHLIVVKDLLDQGKREEAGKEMEQYRQLQKEIYPYVSFGDNDYLDKVLTRMRNSEDRPFLQFPGKLGQMVGPFKRGWLVSFMGPMKRGKCLSKDTNILLSDGSIKTICQIVNEKCNKKVIVLKNNKRLGEENITEFFSNGIKPVYEVVTRTGRRIKATINHPFLTIDGWKNLKLLKEGSFIAVPRELPFFGENVIPNYKLKLLAYLIADGGLTKGVTYTKHDKVIRNDFIRSVIRMGDDITLTKDGTGLYVVKKRGNYSKYNNKSSKTKEWLVELGLFGKKSSEKFIPDIIFSSTKKNISLFLRTLFTGDGSICGNENGNSEISYSSMSKKMILQIQHLLLRFGIVCCVRSRKTNFNIICHGLTIRDKENLLKFIDEIGFSFHKGDKSKIQYKRIKTLKRRRGFIDVFPPEYSLIIKNYIETPKNRVWYRQPPLKWLGQSLRLGTCLSRGVVQDLSSIIKNPQLLDQAYSDILWDKIISIEYIGDEETYDLTIGDNHNFVANDFIVHNSWWIIETSFQAIISRLNCLIVSLEMSAEEVYMRLLKRMTSCSEQEGDVWYPAFDCLHNQDGSCDFKERTSKVPLLINKTFRPKVENADPDYVPCTACRDDHSGSYVPESWYVSVRRKALDYSIADKVVGGLQRTYGLDKSLRILTFPTYSANLSKIKTYLAQWEDTDGWIPDLIAIDYADILAPENESEEGRERINRTWKELKSLASSKQILVVTATQANRESIEKFNVKQVHTGEDIRKQAHVEIMLPLSQTNEEKKRGIIRVGVGAHRHKDFNELASVTVLQNLNMGQPNIDSEFGTITIENTKKKGGEKK